MKVCGVCAAYSASGADFCEYCGAAFFREYRVFSELANLFHSKKYRGGGRVFPFQKNKELYEKINQEIQRAEDINLLLGNVRDREMLGKITGIVAKIYSHVESLIRCRIDLEYIKILSSLNAMINEGKSLKASEVLKYCGELRGAFQESFAGIREIHTTEDLSEYMREKTGDLEAVVERMSILMISSILANASIVNELEYSVESDYRLLEENIDKINYEIDRLSAELAM
jgi:hypothetical protein